MVQTKMRSTMMRTIWGMLLTAMLTFWLLFALNYVYGHNLPSVNDHFDSLPQFALFAIMSSALAGALGVRIGGVTWRQTIPAALLAGWLVLSRLQYELIPVVWMETPAGIQLIPSSLPVLLLLCVSGIFLLPLYDPFVKKLGPAPTRWKVEGSALLLTILILGVRSLLNAYFWPLDELPFAFSLVLLGTAMLLGLVNRSEAAAWVGGTGLLFLFFYVPASFLLVILRGSW
jgi:hypothetical protein